MRSFYTIGVDDFFPGNGTVQVTLVPSHFVGYSPVEMLPLPFGPRQFGQSSWLGLAQATVQTRLAAKIIPGPHFSNCL